MFGVTLKSSGSEERNGKNIILYTPIGKGNVTSSMKLNNPK
jgi:hypothetical protein